MTLRSHKYAILLVVRTVLHCDRGRAAGGCEALPGAAAKQLALIRRRSIPFSAQIPYLKPDARNPNPTLSPTVRDARGRRAGNLGLVAETEKDAPLLSCRPYGSSSFLKKKGRTVYWTKVQYTALLGLARSV